MPPPVTCASARTRPASITGQSAGPRITSYNVCYTKLLRNASWIENAWTPSETNRQLKLTEYTALYGEDNALYLVDVETTTKNYNTAAYVYWDELPFPACEQYTKDAAAYYGWQFDKVKGESDWLRDLVEGRWDTRFAVARPGEKLAADYTGHIITIEDPIEFLFTSNSYNFV